MTELGKRLAVSTSVDRHGKPVWKIRDDRPEWVRRMDEQRAQKGLIALKEVVS